MKLRRLTEKHVQGYRVSLMQILNDSSETLFIY